MTHDLTVFTRGYERSVLVKRGTTIVAEVYTDTEPGDQYTTAALFAAAPDLLAALRAAYVAACNWIPTEANGRAYKESAIKQIDAAINKATGGQL